METKVLLVTPKAAEVINLVKGAVSKTPTGVSFISVRWYTNKEGETSHYSINIGASYENAVRKDIEFLKNLEVTDHKWKSSMVDILQAKQELLTAFISPNKKLSDGQTNAYEKIIGGALKVHKETGNLMVYGYLKSKKVVIPGEYKSVNSSALTIAKNEIRKHLRTGKFRMFSLDTFNQLKADHKTLQIWFPPKAVVL